MLGVFSGNTPITLSRGFSIETLTGVTWSWKTKLNRSISTMEDKIPGWLQYRYKTCCKQGGCCERWACMFWRWLHHEGVVSGWVDLYMTIPYAIDIDSKWVDNFFKCIVVKNEICFKVLDKICQIFNKVIFFLAILDERLFCCMNIFLNYWYVNGNRGIIWCKSLV